MVSNEKVAEKMKAAIEAFDKRITPVYCTECKHYWEFDSEYVANAVVTECLAGYFPIDRPIPDGWYCAGGEGK